MKNELFSGESLNVEIVKERIYIIRGRKVMLDKDLALLYGVQTGALNQAVKRNINRFPDDFMFPLNTKEINLISQIVISSYGGVRRPPYAFTEQGIAMLSSVLKSQRAIQINIQIIRIFTKLREMIDSYKELREKVEEMEKSNETNFQEIFKIIRLIINKESEPKDQIGFNVED
ncbi:MAG: ORF6N domain-containing protein [Candidatus Pacebacteria bacterium]|nr:ORF6N domain-containing protein [Candidatus Paceibacterota bacterium]